ncbi:ROK family protein [Niveispirillum sp. KHB5.9]|uniref:ROK family protein n=1 Tax=Niveispirillum sp. KHB5.9 TaxID=3400269 RepID=UPI003A8683A8
MLAAIEAGGTKFVCGIGDATGSRLTRTIPTRDPDSTLADVARFLAEAAAEHGAFTAIGIGSFGPLDLDRTSPTYGSIAATPKPGWAGTDMPGFLKARFGVPVAIDTDVNVAALAEARLSGVRRLAYVTVGTGIGVGFARNGETETGFGHAEAGHIPVRRHADHGIFAGTCPFHGDCLEGMASGPAIKAAWGHSLEGLPPDHPAWDVTATYLGQLCRTLILTTMPERIVLGGGVMAQERLLPLVREATEKQLNGYCGPWTHEAFTTRIHLPQSQEPPGLVGAYLLAATVADQ